MPTVEKALAPTLSQHQSRGADNDFETLLGFISGRPDRDTAETAKPGTTDGSPGFENPAPEAVEITSLPVETRPAQDRRRADNGSGTRLSSVASASKSSEAGSSPATERILSLDQAIQKAAGPDPIEPQPTGKPASKPSEPPLSAASVYVNVAGTEPVVENETEPTSAPVKPATALIGRPLPGGVAQNQETTASIGETSNGDERLVRAVAARRERASGSRIADREDVVDQTVQLRSPDSSAGAIHIVEPISGRAAGSHSTVPPPLNPDGPEPNVAAVSANPANHVEALPVAPEPGNATQAQSLDEPRGRDAIVMDSSQFPIAAGSASSPAAPSGPVTVPPEEPVRQSDPNVTEQIAIHVAKALNDGGKTVTVELHPADLGRVEIRFSFHSDGLDVRMTIDRPETFVAFSHDRAGLERQLTQAGVDLGGGGLDLRLGQQPDHPDSYSGGRNPGAQSPAPQTKQTRPVSWTSNGLLNILA